MPEAAGFHQPLLINTIGHGAGALLFAAFLLLGLRRPQAGSDWPLAAAAAALAFLWDSGSLLTLALGRVESPLAPWMGAVSFAAFSLLPAVLLHLAFGPRARWARATAYALSAAAAALHLSELLTGGPEFHDPGLRLIAFGFGGLTIAALTAERTTVRAPSRSRTLAAMSLFLLAASFAHFGNQAAESAWQIELLVHHAALPLALYVLLQDYRFLWVDAFARLAASAAAAGAFIAVAAFVHVRFDLFRAANDPVGLGILLLAVCGWLILFASVRNSLEGWLMSAVFRRGSLPDAVEELRRLAAAAPSEQEFLEAALEHIAAFFSASPSAWGGADADPEWVEAAAPLRLSSGEGRRLLLGRREGARPYLSEDLRGLAVLAAAVAEQVERLRRAELERLSLQAELRALRAQIHPHFLFNSLNALYGLIPKSAPKARATLLHLAELLRSFLRVEQDQSPLGEEVRLLETYLAIEKVRLGERLRASFEIDPEAAGVEIPALSLQPLVENAVKYAVTPRPEGGIVRVTARLVDGRLETAVEDDGPGFEPGWKEGAGLSNVRRRLKLRFGAEADLRIESTADGARVGFSIPR